jgi:hypothetical protein
MNINRIPIDLPDKTHPYRHYCLNFDNAFLKHKDPIVDRGISYEWMEAWHDKKQIQLEKKDYEKAGRYDLIYGEEDLRDKWDKKIEGNTFLLYDNAGLNYAHFFFDFFGRVLYFEELSKTIPNLKIAIPEDYYKTEGNSTFVKQWLDLYFSDKLPEIIVLQKDITYLVPNLYLPGVLYTFPEPQGDDFVIQKIIETLNKVSKIETQTNGCYISRQDTIKRGWYHKRNLVNELELIDKIKNELGYDIIELMDYDMIGKIQIFKSYKNIIQQSSASNVSLLFSNKENTNILISHPYMEGWLNSKCQQFSQKSKTNLITLDGGGEIAEQVGDDYIDKNNAPWELSNLDGLMDILHQIDKGNI